MTATDITPEQRLTIVKHLAGAKTFPVVSAIVSLPEETIRQIAHQHGYPDTEKLKWAVDVLTKKAEEAETATRPQGVTPTPASDAVRAARPAPATPQPATPVATERPDEFRVLINTAKNHDRVRIQKLAEKILEDCAKLRGLIDDERAAFEERQQAAREKAEARAEVERLEQQLKDAKAKLRGPSTPPSNTDGPSATAIRTWAAEAGVECPTRGRVPKDVRDAYDAAHAA